MALINGMSTVTQEDIRSPVPTPQRYYNVMVRLQFSIVHRHSGLFYIERRQRGETENEKFVTAPPPAAPAIFLKNRVKLRVH